MDFSQDLHVARVFRQLLQEILVLAEGLEVPVLLDRLINPLPLGVALQLPDCGGKFLLPSFLPNAGLREPPGFAHLKYLLRWAHVVLRLKLLDCLSDHRKGRDHDVRLRKSG